MKVSIIIPVCNARAFIEEVLLRVHVDTAVEGPSEKVGTSGHWLAMVPRKEGTQGLETQRSRRGKPC
jgi:hypothetical protein